MENKTPEHGSSQGKTLTCPSCGAEVSARRRYCPECGAVVRPFSRGAEKPAAELPSEKPPAATDNEPTVPSDNEHIDAVTTQPDEVAEQAEPTVGSGPMRPVYPDNSDLFGFDEPPPIRCAHCGNTVRGGSKFCMYCGAPLSAQTPKAAPVTLKTCEYCGVLVGDADRFCRHCGWTLADGATGLYGDKDGNVDGAAKNKRKIVDILGFLAIVFSGILTAVFAVTPYVGFVADGAVYADIGLYLIAALFGAKSPLNAFGVAYDDIKHAGWTYFALMLGVALCLVCFIINVIRKKNRRQFGTLISSIYQTVPALSLFISSLVSAATIGANGGSVFYIGGIGVIVCAVIGLVLAIVSAKKSHEVYPRIAAKMTRPRVGYFVTLGVAVVTAAATFFLPLVALSSVGAISAGDGGRATLRINERYNEYYIGTTVFELTGLETGATYSFTADFDSYIAAENLEGCLLLCYAENVCGDDKTSLDIITSRYITANQSCGVSTARLTFVNTYSRELAVVVNAASYSIGSMSFDYSFKKQK